MRKAEIIFRENIVILNECITKIVTKELVISIKY